MTRLEDLTVGSMVNGLVNNEIEQEEENVADQASAARTIKELEVEIATLKDLECMANEVRLSGEERKWDEFSRLLQDNDCMFTPDGQREKFIIFIENRATLRYLTDKIRTPRQRLCTRQTRARPNAAAVRGKGSRLCAVLPPCTRLLRR
jgi:hypothetical protein